MRTSFLAALVGGFAGASAFKTDSIARIDKPGSLERGHCGSLDPCKYAPPGSYVPDPKTFFLPHDRNKRDNHWGLCKNDPYCKNCDIYSKVKFDFKDDAIVFDFNIPGAHYEDVEIKIQRGAPPTAHSPKFNFYSGHCHSNNHGGLSVKIPYHALNCNGWTDMCPAKEEGGWVFYVEIKATIYVHGKKVTLYNQAIAKQPEVRWFSLSYCCSKCPDCRPPVPLAPPSPCKKPGCTEPHYPPHGHHHHHHVHHKQHECHHGCPKPCPHHPKPHHQGPPHHGPPHHAPPHHAPPHHAPPHHAPPHHAPPHHAPPHHAPPHHAPPHHAPPHHPPHHGTWPRAEVEEKTNEKRGERVEDTVAEVTEAKDDKVARNSRPSGHHHHGTHNHHGHEVDIACESAQVVIFGQGQHCHSLSELSRYPGHEECRNRPGHYHTYVKHDLEVTVAGALELNNNAFGSFIVEFDKHNKDTEIVIKIDVWNALYYVVETAVFIDCKEGIEQGWGGRHGAHICRPETFPYWYVDEQGIGNYDFHIKDEFKCKGDYVFALWVKVCIADDSRDCQYHRIPLVN